MNVGVGSWNLDWKLERNLLSCCLDLGLDLDWIWSLDLDLGTATIERIREDI